MKIKLRYRQTSRKSQGYQKQAQHFEKPPNEFNVKVCKYYRLCLVSVFSISFSVLQ